MISTLSLLSANLGPEVLSAKQNICFTRQGRANVTGCKKALDIQRDTEQSWSEKSVPAGLAPCLSPYDNLPFIWEGQTEVRVIGRGRMITSRWQEERSLPWERVRLKKEEEKKRGLSCWLWQAFKKWFTLLNVWPTPPPRVWCWDGAISVTRWPDKKRECVCSVLHSSLTAWPILWRQVVQVTHIHTSSRAAPFKACVYNNSPSWSCYMPGQGSGSPQAYCTSVSPHLSAAQFAQVSR